MEKRYETRSGDLFVRSWARVRRVSLDRRNRWCLVLKDFVRSLPHPLIHQAGY